MNHRLPLGVNHSRVSSVAVCPYVQFLKMQSLVSCYDHLCWTSSICRSEAPSTRLSTPKGNLHGPGRLQGPPGCHTGFQGPPGTWRMRQVGGEQVRALVLGPPACRGSAAQLCPSVQGGPWQPSALGCFPWLCCPVTPSHFLLPGPAQWLVVFLHPTF